MHFELSPATFVAFLLALVRASAWVAIGPPFSSRMIPVQVKIGLAAALALSVTPQLATQDIPMSTPGLIGAIALQVVLGLALGYLTQVLFTAVQAAGELVDLFGGFTIASAYDPFSQSVSSVFGRFYNLLATMILFAINGHLLLVKGFLTSFTAVGVTGLRMSDFSELLLHDIGLFMLAAVQIAAPLLAVLFLSEVGLGLLTRAALQFNVFAVAMPAKILLTLTLAGLALPLLPDALSNLLDDALRSGATVAEDSMVAAPTPEIVVRR